MASVMRLEKGDGKSMSTAVQNFEGMSRIELLDFCRDLYARIGISALTYPALKSIPKLYNILYRSGLGQKDLIKELGLVKEYKQHILARPHKYGDGERTRWSWDLLVQKAIVISDAEGRLPPALWFQKNGHGAFIQALYNLGHTWDQLREAVGDFTNSNFVQSRNQMRWLSHAEASLSNFLYARGVEHKKGTRYDDSFAAVSPTRYAIYDMHIKGYSGSWFDIEVWGDRPNGHSEERYASVRAAKEAFNAHNSNFLGIHHADCYVEQRLAEILSPVVGAIQPFQFDKPTDALLHSTHWSNADELLDFCKNLASKMPDGKFPAEDWLRKRGKWATRDGETFNTLSVYIKQWLGGVRNLRILIGQPEASTQKWDKESALAAYKMFYDQHGLTPQQVRHNSRRKHDEKASEEVVLQAIRISSAVEKYAGGAAAANAAFGLELVRQVRWTKAALLGAIKHLFDQYGRSPNQLIADHKKGYLQTSREALILAGQVKDAASRYPGGLTAIQKELGIPAPKRTGRPSQ